MTRMGILNNRKRRPTHPGALLREEILPLRRQGFGPAEIGAFVGSLYLPCAFKWIMGIPDCRR